MKPIQVKTNLRMTQGLGLYLPSDVARKYELEHRVEDKQNVNITIPLSMLRAIFETVAAMSANDVGVILGRYIGLNNDTATLINDSLTQFVKMCMGQGMKPRFRPGGDEPWSWRISKEMGWDQVKR